MEQENKRKKQIVCPANVCEDVTITLPIETNAHVDIGDIELKCKERLITKEHDKHKNKITAHVIQKVSLKIPIKFITEVDVRDEQVDFKVQEC